MDNTTPTWVTLATAATALGLGTRRTYQLAKSENWHTAPGSRPKQYAFADVTRTWRRLNQKDPK
jgi:hypothetical protein